MALAVDAVTSARVGGVTSLTISHTCSGANRVLRTGVSWAGFAITVTGVTYAGAALSSIGSRVDADDNTGIHIWRRIAPATGANDVVITMSASCTDIVCGNISFTGADQTTPDGAFNSAIGNSTTPSVVITSATGEIVMDTLDYAEVGAAPGAGQTEQWDSSTGAAINGAGSTEAGAASVTMSWTITSAGWVTGGAAVKPVAAGGGSFFEFRVPQFA